MRNTLVPIYYGQTAHEAQGLADELHRVGIEAFVDSTESPMYGMRAGPSSNVLYAREPITELVREVVDRYEHQGHPQVPREERQREQTGLEAPAGDRPRDDSPSEGVGETTDLMDQDRPGAQTPELAAFNGRELADEDIESIGPDRPLVQRALFESDEIEDPDIDDLQIVEWYTEEEREI